MLNQQIVKAIGVTLALTGSDMPDVGVEAMAEHLSSAYPLTAVLQALKRCQIELRGALTLGAVIDRLDDGHLGPESAWALVATTGEEDTVVWTDEIAQAWGLARNLDRVQGRMVFLEAYRERLAQARSVQRPPRWWASLGWDPRARVDALREAVALGRLPSHVLAELPEGPRTPPAPALTGMIRGMAREAQPEEAGQAREEAPTAGAASLRLPDQDSYTMGLR